MLIHELTRAQCLEVLMRVTVGRLACARHDQPYIVPVSLYFDSTDACLYSFSTVGQKIQWMRANPRVCVEVDEIGDHLHWTTVVVTGRYEEIHGGMRAGSAHARALELFQQRSDWWFPAAGKLAARDEHEMPVVYRVHIDKVSGRRAAKPQV
jgi:nitroimidazol reductase NimA-like FMN-containing flavoprotein (pyridoxamine 5'-phosphate oxidase superfamily)